MNEALLAAPPPLTQATSRAPVLMPALVPEPFDYLVPEGTPEGTLVEAKLAGRTLIGAIWSSTPNAASAPASPAGEATRLSASALSRSGEGASPQAPKQIPLSKLKPITRTLDNLPPLKPQFRQWLDWISDFTLAPKGAVLSLCGLTHAAKTPKKPLPPQQFQITLPTLTTSQQTVADLLVTEARSAKTLPLRGRAGVGADPRNNLPHITLPLPKTRDFARKLRTEMPDAESELWHHLRRENLGAKFRKQHPIGKYIADFACLEIKLIIELDGGQHNEPDAIKHDATRTAFLESQGFKVIRFWNNDVLQNTDAVLERITEEIGALQSPHPSPPPRGEGLSRTTAPKPILLDGVTGSGKTEVYFHAIAAAIAAQKQTLVLLPEIALTHQWLERFEKTFGTKPVVWHSRMTPAAKAKAWQSIARGESQVVVGARSALFLPFANLALIIIDEEHDPSYKQEDGVLYHARDMAIVRAHFERIPIILVSATPSLETMENVREGKYRLAHLPTRFGAAGLPTVRLVDMRNDPPERGEFLSPSAKKAMLETLARNEQILFFLNRRGYAPLLLCRGCGHRFQCSNCSAWLVVHGKKELRCHHCNHHEPMPKECPSCKADAEKLAPCGPGVERIMEEVRGLFAATETPPKLALLSSDESITPETWSDIESGNIDIIVGTQMVAKGHHFPRLTLVVVVDADVGLDGADLRAGERTYQLLHQLGGRAGRGELAGTVLVQTYAPEHPVMSALVAHDRDRLMALEAKERKAGNWPPFGQLAAILLDGKDDATVRAAGQMLARTAPDDKRLRVLGPAPAPLSKLRGQYRYRLLVKATDGIHLQRTLRNWLADQKFSGVRIKVDVNPYYFL